MIQCTSGCDNHYSLLSARPSSVALTIALSLAVARDRRKQARHAVRVDTWLCEPVVHHSTRRELLGRAQPVIPLTDVTRLNFFEVARAAFFSKY